MNHVSGMSEAVQIVELDNVPMLLIQQTQILIVILFSRIVGQMEQVVLLNQLPVQLIRELRVLVRHLLGNVLM